jgi:hypothetical protein
VVVGVPIIAAGVALTSIGAKLCLLSKKYEWNSQSKMHQEQFVLGANKFSARHAKLMESNTVKDAYKNADHQVRKAH